MRNPFRVIWNYLKNSWEDDHGQFSFKRASAFAFVALVIFMVLKNRIADRWNFYAFLALLVTFCIIVSIITVPQLIRMIKYGSQLGRPTDPFNTLNTFNDEKDHNAGLPSSANSPINSNPDGV